MSSNDAAEGLMQSPMAALLEQAQGDPRTMLILNALRQATERPSADSEVDQLRARVEALTRANSALRGRLGAVAAALGACPRCLGESPECPVCGGDGVPGARRPELDGFAHYVIPAVRRARPHLTRRSEATALQTEVS